MILARCRNWSGHFRQKPFNIMEKRTFKFAIGYQMDYMLNENVLFSGKITGIDENPKNKPYILEDADGKVYFANEELLRFTPQPLPKAGEIYSKEVTGLRFDNTRFVGTLKFKIVSVNSMDIITASFEDVVDEIAKMRHTGEGGIKTKFWSYLFNSYKMKKIN